MARPLRLLVTGYFQRGNLGDDLMLRGLESKLAAHEEIEYRVARYPEWRALPWRESWRYLRGVLTADLVVISGGTQLHDSIPRRSHAILTVKLLLLLGARMTRRRVAYAGIGVGPVRTGPGRWLVRRMLSLTEVAYVRDHASAEEVARIAPDVPVITGTDMAFLLGQGRERPFGAAEDCRLGVSLLPFFSIFGGKDEADAEVARNLADAIAGLEPRPAVSLLAFSTAARSDDRRALRPLFEALVARGVEADLVECRDVEETLAVLGRCRAVIATRYHSIVAAALAETPAAVISYAPKCSSVASDLGVPDEAVVAPEALLDVEQTQAFVARAWGARPYERACLDAVYARSDAACEEFIAQLDAGRRR
jgi:polysaccharide pyruvyl transferase WcaK-like protein